MEGSLMQLPLEVQLALAGGYLGYCAAYAGLRRGHSGTDTAMISLAFGLAAVATFRLLGCLPDRFVWVQLCAGVTVAVIIGALWRKWGRDLVFHALKAAGVHQDDGLVSAWDGLIQQPGLSVTQLRVVTRDGRDLWCSDAGSYQAAPGKGMIIGVDGAIMMVVEEESILGESGVERPDVSSDSWGVRLTYIPADNIARVEMRCASTS